MKRQTKHAKHFALVGRNNEKLLRHVLCVYVTTLHMWDKHGIHHNFK